MFILTGVTALSRDSNSIPVNPNNNRDVAEHRIMALESLLTDLILNGGGQIDYDLNTPGPQVQLPSFFNEDGSNEPFIVNEWAVQQMLYEERNNPALGGEDPIDDATPRIQEIQLKISEAKNRIITLVTLSQEIQLNPERNIFLGQIDQDFNMPGTQVNIDGILRITAEANQVRQALYIARAYLGELETSKEFWKEEKKTKNLENSQEWLDGYYFKSKKHLSGDLNKDGLVDWFDVVFLRALLSGRINIDEWAKKLGLSKVEAQAMIKDLDVNGDGKVNEDDIKTLKRILLPPIWADKIPEPGRQYNAINKKHDDAVNQYKYKEQNT